MDPNDDNSDGDEGSSNEEEVISVKTCVIYLYNFNNKKFIIDLIYS